MVVSQGWERVITQSHSVGQPHLVYMPEQDRLLLTANPDSQVIFSDDHGATWTEPRPMHTNVQGNPDAGDVRSVNYLGTGRLILGTHSTRWFSTDYGHTWGDPLPLPPEASDQPWNQWDPCLVDRDPRTGKVVRLAETGWNRAGGSWPQTPEQAFIRFSHDEGRTWQDQISVPQWYGFNEVALCRAPNGHIIAACRSHMPRWYGGRSDYFSGFGVSISQDNGNTWSQVTMLYTYGRHHPCMVALDDGRIVMTYVVRLGYPGDIAGYAQRGIEAVVSNDNGVTWDVGHHFVLHKWSCSQFRDAPQSTTTVALPNRQILTAYGAGYRTRRPDGEPYEDLEQAPHDIVLIRWQLP